MEGKLAGLQNCGKVEENKCKQGFERRHVKTEGLVHVSAILCREGKTRIKEGFRKKAKVVVKLARKVA